MNIFHLARWEIIKLKVFTDCIVISKKKKQARKENKKSRAAFKY